MVPAPLPTTHSFCIVDLVANDGSSSSHPSVDKYLSLLCTTATYMEEEWGHEQHGDLKLFEMLTLEGAQAGLSWSTILKKRENYR